MRNRIVASVVRLMLCVGAVSTARAQTGTVRGRVLDSTGTAIPGAIITIDRSAVRTQATSAGNYVLHGVPVGRQTVRARIISYSPVAADLPVRANESVIQDFTLSRS